MIQVCDPPRQRQVRRLSAEEFFTLVRCGGAGFYRPRTEVLRMLTAGEAWGTAGAALLVLPLTADTAAAAALRNWLGRRQLEGGCLLTPPVNFISTFSTFTLNIIKCSIPTSPNLCCKIGHSSSILCFNA